MFEKERFEKENRPADAFLWTAPHGDADAGVPSSCCSPIIAGLNTLMKVTDAELASTSHWRARGRGLPPASAKRQIFVNARIRTMDDANPIADAMAIKGGRILAIGNSAQALAESDQDAEYIDCCGRFMLPGFIEPHMHFLHDEQIARIKKLGLSPSFLIGHVYYWGKAMRDNIFGEHNARLLDRTAAGEAAGIRWTLHSDEPVTEMGPLRCIENAVTRKMWKEPNSRLAPEERVSVEVALRAMTRDAAWQCHSDHEIGSLEPGKLADFVILDQDPREVPSDEIGAIRVLETWMGGRKVYG